NTIIHCYAYWKGIYIRDIKELEEEIRALNDKFKQPLKDTEIKAILRCIPKATDKFIRYEQGVRSGEVKRVTKGMRDKEGYWYKNETLIERLEITEEEQRELKTIIGTRVKYDRNNLKRTPRNEEGLTKKQQELQELKNKVIELKEQGLSNVKIAEKLGTNESKIRRVLKV
ncbi:MAG: DNA-binding response regulator, partial [Clostridium sp.]